MTKKTFDDLYDIQRSCDDNDFMKTYKKLLPLFNSLEDRIQHRAKYWGCWLRFHRRIKNTNKIFYIFRIMNSDIKEHKAFDYLNEKDKK